MVLERAASVAVCPTVLPSTLAFFPPSDGFSALLPLRLPKGLGLSESEDREARLLASLAPLRFGKAEMRSPCLVAAVREGSPPVALGMPRRLGPGSPAVLALKLFWL